VGVVGLRVCTPAKAHPASILIRVLDADAAFGAREPRIDCLALGPFQVLPALGARFHNNLARNASVDNDALPGLAVVLAGGGGGH